MIDIHCHILPGIDDGPSSLSEALAMARQAVGDGIHAIVATPHTLNGVYTNDRASVLSAVAEMQSFLSGQKIDLKLYAGGDTHLTDHMAERVHAGEICTIADRSRHLLLEMPRHVLPRAVQTEVYALRLNGLTPIITHPERNDTIQRDPGLLLDLIRMGALSQITAMSLTGGFGRLVRSVAKKLVAQRLVHLIATDAHSPDHRPVSLSAAVHVAAEILGSTDEAERMVTAVPSAILAGESPEIPEPALRPGGRVERAARV